MLALRTRNPYLFMYLNDVMFRLCTVMDNITFPPSLDCPMRTEQTFDRIVMSFIPAIPGLSDANRMYFRPDCHVIHSRHP